MKSLTNKKKISSVILKVGQNRVWFDKNRLEEIKEAITKADIRSLIRDKAIQAKPKTGQSSYRKRKKLKQKRKGRGKGAGKRKGKKTSRLSKKEAWMIKIRNQRVSLNELKERGLISTKTYRQMYLKAKGGFFRSKRHLRLFLKEHDLLKK